MQSFCWKKTRKTYDDGLGAAVGVRICSLLIYVDFYMKCMTVCKGEDQQGEDSHHSISTRVVRRQRHTYLFHRTRVYVNLRGKLHLVSFEEIRGKCKNQASRGKECAKVGIEWVERYFATWNEAINGFRSIMMSKKNQTLLFKKERINTNISRFLHLS